MRRLYLERTLNIKQERLREDVSQWLNCRFLPYLPMIFTHCLEMRSQVTESLTCISQALDPMDTETGYGLPSTGKKAQLLIGMAC